MSPRNWAQPMNVVAVEGAMHNIKANAIAPIARTRMTEDLLGPLVELVDPNQVTPMVVYLASRDCENSHEIWTVGGGRYARIFVGVNQGWFAGKGTPPSVEDVRDHLDEIRDIDSYTVPANSTEEMMLLGAVLAD